MDTKSKSFKYSTLSKGICLFLALVFACASAWCSASAAGKVLFCGDFDNRSETETVAFTYYTRYQLNRIMQYVSLDGFAERLEKDREKNLSRVLKEYKKLNNGKYDDIRIELLSDEMKKMSDDNVYCVDLWWSVYFDSGLTDSQVLEIAEEEYDNYIDYLVGVTGSVDTDKKCGIDYYIVTSDGSVYTNCADADEKKIKKEFSASPIYLISENGKTSQSGFDNALSKTYRTYFDTVRTDAVAENFIKLTKDSTVYIKADIDNGIYNRMCSINRYFSSFTFTFAVICALLTLAAAIIFLTAFARLTGHSENGVRMSMFDKMPTDLHFVLSAVFTAAFAVGMVFVCVYGLSMLDVSYDLIESPLCNLLFTKTALFICALFGGLSFLFFTLWVGSAARIKKCNKSFFSKFIIAYLIKGIIAAVKFTFTKVKAGVQAALYKPKKFRRWIVFAFFGVLGVDLFSAITGFCLVNDGFTEGAVIIGIPVGLMNLAVIYFIISYMTKLDEIITASEEKRQPELDTEKLPVSLKALTDSITVTNAQLECAVQQALKDERMKTELITNVSHDLKTPLTSIISYVELLGRCEIYDEDARKYISVLEEKSARLKTLVEDLVEASKASSGAVTLEKTGFDLTELVLQAVGETNDDFEKNHLELIFNEPAQRPKVYADSRKTYRAIENLFSNARKYSVPGSRVYVTAGEENGMGYMQIKNMSRLMLNISPDELTERFVRGDSSRTDGGSGLGLAIAKDLCTLQDGSLKIEIDGDLFKATVYLPLYTA